MADNQDTRDTSVDNGVMRDNAGLAEGGGAALSDLTEGEVGAASQEPQDTQVEVGNLASMDVSGRAEDPYEGAVPPGYDWPTHGGYLGCLMGVVAATIVAMFLTAPVLYFADIPLAVVWLLRVVIFLACIIGGGRLGWALGKRFYREYPHERPTWGESDDADVEGIEAKDSDTASEARAKM